MRITGDSFFNEEVVGSVRSKVLQKLLLLCCNARLKRSLREEVLENAGNADEAPLLDVVDRLKPKHVMPMIGVSERTATEYIHCLKIIVAFATPHSQRELLRLTATLHEKG